MIDKDPSAPFKIGNRVRLLNGPVLTVMRPVDEDREVLCCWWTDYGQLGFVYAPEALLVHVQNVPLVTDPVYKHLCESYRPKRKPAFHGIKAAISGWLARGEIRRS